MNVLKDSKGNTKYYASYDSAWKAANRLNEQLAAGDFNCWYFEMDLTGWFLFQDEMVGA